MLKFFKNKISKISKPNIDLDTRDIDLENNEIKINNELIDLNAGSIELYDEIINNNIKQIKYYSIDKNKYIETYVPSHMNIFNNNNNFINFDNVKDTRNDNVKDTKNDNDVVSKKIYSYIKTEDDILNEIYDYYLNDSCQKDKKFDYIDKYFSYDIMTGVYYYKTD